MTGSVCSQPCVTIAVISSVITGVIAAAISVVVTYCVNRKLREQKQTDIPLESLQGSAQSTSRADSARYATGETRLQKAVKKSTAEASPSVQASGKSSVKYSKSDDQVYQKPMAASEHYMHVLHSGLQNVNEPTHYQKGGTTSGYMKPIPCRKPGEKEGRNLPISSRRQHEGMPYSNPGFPNVAIEEQVYANQ